MGGREGIGSEMSIVVAGESGFLLLVCDGDVL